jgi:hypothetical protein
MLLTETEQTETLFAMVLFGLVAIAGIALLVAVTIDNALWLTGGPRFVLMRLATKPGKITRQRLTYWFRKTSPERD